jgi:hypothetical protein
MNLAALLLTFKKNPQGICNWRGGDGAKNKSVFVASKKILYYSTHFGKKCSTFTLVST